MPQDLNLTCSDCGGDFLHSASEQDFFKTKGFQPPKRCKPCRTNRKKVKDAAEGSSNDTTKIRKD